MIFCDSGSPGRAQGFFRKHYRLAHFPALLEMKAAYRLTREMLSANAEDEDENNNGERMSQLDMIYEEQAEMEDFSSSSLQQRSLSQPKSNTFDKSRSHSNTLLQHVTEDSKLNMDDGAAPGIQVYNIDVLRSSNVKPTVSTAGFGQAQATPDEGQTITSLEKIIEPKSLRRENKHLSISLGPIARLIGKRMTYKEER